jgi:predicted ATPase/DNA-binding SARP family transcriptional activator
MHGVEYSILGPLAVWPSPDAEPVALGERVLLLLARLLIEPRLTISGRDLTADVWSEESELKDPKNTLHVAVRQLRDKLGDRETQSLIVRVGAGYRVAVDDALQIDAERFRLLATRGRALISDRPQSARVMLEEAQRMWRGRVLGEHADARWVAPHALELESLRAAAEADLNEVRLRLGDHAGLEPALRGQITQHPEDERRRAQLVRALDAAGRAAEASLAYREATRDLGAVGPELRRLGDRIGRGLRADPRPAASAPLDAGAAATPLLCAALPDDPAGRPGPGLGTLALLVDRAGGVAHPLSDRELLATFDELDTAVEVAEALAADIWLRPAVGVHAGPTIRVGDRLLGGAAARCRLLTRAASAGQVLVSDDARARLSPTVQLEDLGTQRLEDLLVDQPVYGLHAPGHELAAQPLPVSSDPPHNLPAQPTRFIGRDRELAALARAVAPGQVITLLGAGGCGKTRLALQLAERRGAAFRDGAWLVELAELDEGTPLDPLAEAVGHQLGVRPLPEESPAQAISRHFSDRSALLILDNCEHVLDAAVALTGLVHVDAPQVCVVATSRTPLRLDGERVVEVPAMDAKPVEDPGDLPEAVELLLDRAGPLGDGLSGDQVLADATRICRAFEGSPLAIELAASHVALRGLATVAAEVEAVVHGKLGLDHFASSDPRRSPRQRTIEAAVRWSHALLSDAEREVLHQLAVFRGPFTLDEARLIPAGGGLAPDEVAVVIRRLIDRSVVELLTDTTTMRLSQSVQAFALAQLDANALARVRGLHADVYGALARRMAPRLFGPDERLALERLEGAHDNFKAALGWLIEERRADDALALIGALWWLWFSHGHLDDGGRLVDEVLALDATPSRARVRALRVASHLAWWRGDYTQTDVYNSQLEACATAIDDAWGLAWAPMGFGAVLMFHDPKQALGLFEDSRRGFQALGHDWEAGYALQLIGAAQWFAGDEASAGTAYEQASEIFHRLDHGSVLSSVRRGAGLMAARCGHPGRGEALCADALRIADAIGDRAGSVQALNFLAAISRDRGDLDTALDRYADALAQARQIGELWATCWALDGIAGIACARGDAEIAVRLFSRSQQLADRAGYRQSVKDQEIRAADLATLRRALDRADFERATTEGELLDLGDAVLDALSYGRS